ncbi:MAG: response regulator [Deltaproteobacteria bacterium]|nr:response regulator [Deltaproteobacteria bacterium]MBW2082102.1 response regulator [Deltaproteobacteria bacterium]HDM10285.1 response regulator [Desulfobacteraceae bacterium]
MGELEILEGKKVLVVDDEEDILETLEELLDMCLIDKAPNYETAMKFLKKNTYDLAILDIMGVRGYDLLEETRKRGVPAVMLTAHALSPENLIKSVKGGAQAYLPKDKMSDIPTYVTEVLKAVKEGEKASLGWFKKLNPFFEKKFGPDWKEKHKDLWDAMEQTYRVSREDLEQLM